MEVSALPFQNTAKPKKNLTDVYFDCKQLNNRLFHPVKDAYETRTVIVQISRILALVW